MNSNFDGHRRIGHYYWDRVDVVYLDPEKGQYIIDPDEGKMFRTYLRDGQTWCDEFITNPVPQAQRPKFFRRALHEVGHAAACFLAGIKVEFVTIMPSGDGLMPILGLCKYDYDIDSHRSADPMLWNTRLMLAHLGGPVAEREYLTRHSLPVEPEHPHAWSGDERNVLRCLEAMPLVAEARARLRAAAENVLCEQFKAHWSGLEKAADLLVTKGAISGETARDCLGDMELIDLAPFELT